jgi:hypothetical protein
VAKVGDLGHIDTPDAEVKPELSGVRPKAAPPKPAISQLFGRSIPSTAFGTNMISLFPLRRVLRHERCAGP